MSVARIQAHIQQEGETVTLRRITGSTSQTVVDVVCKAAVRPLQRDPRQLVGPMEQSDRLVILGITEMLVAGWPMPPRPGDQIVIGGAVTNIERAIPLTFRNETAFYEIRVRG